MIGRTEFIALIAMMFSTIAFSIDAMLPAMPEIAADLTPDAPNRAPLILTFFVIGMGLGTFVTGPLSDAFGRKPLVYAGAALYCLSAAVAWMAQSLELVLAARLMQGLGAAGPRVVAVAIIRDLFAGREMARIMSIAMILFTLVPAFAPAMGALIMMVTGWRGIFGAFITFSAISVLWLGLRLPETLERTNRRPLRLGLMTAAVREMLTHPTVRLSIAVQTLAMTMLFSTLTMIQPIYDVSFDRAETFPYWFGVIALISGTASLANAVIVVRLGMLRLVTWALGTQIVLSSVLLILLVSDVQGGFYIFMLWQFALFCQAGFTVGNLNAIAMEPMGHIAGMAASVIGSISTVLAALFASPIAMLFDGTPIPLIATVLALSGLGFILMRMMARAGRRLPP